MNDIVKEITSEDWSTLLQKQSKPIMVMFYNPTCPHCQIMDSTFTKNAETFSDKVTFLKYNIQQNHQIPYHYGVQSTPTFIYYCQSQPISMITGAVNSSILQHIIRDGLQYGKHCALNRTHINYDASGYL